MIESNRIFLNAVLLTNTNLDFVWENLCVCESCIEFRMVAIVKLMIQILSLKTLK